MSESRKPRYRGNPNLEKLLRELTRLLAPAERLALAEVPQSSHPTVLVIGPPRSGTTLVMQWLAASGSFCYPSNLMARFYGAPAIGARIQRLLLDPKFKFQDELADLEPMPPTASDPTSDLGKTRGALSPSEMWGFWRRFLPVTELERIGDRINLVDGAGLRASLSAIASVFEKPLALKGMIVQFDLPAFAEILPRALFLYIRRDPVANAASLLGARERYFGNRNRWYSVRPPEYHDLLNRPPLAQVAGQVFHTHHHIRRGLGEIDPKRWVTVDYEAFCARPHEVWAELAHRLSVDGSEIGPYLGPPRFSARGRSQLAHTELAAIADELRHLVGAHDSACGAMSDSARKSGL